MRKKIDRVFIDDCLICSIAKSNVKNWKFFFFFYNNDRIWEISFLLHKIYFLILDFFYYFLSILQTKKLDSIWKTDVTYNTILHQFNNWQIRIILLTEPVFKTTKNILCGFVSLCLDESTDFPSKAITSINSYFCDTKRNPTFRRNRKFLSLFLSLSSEA